MDVQDKPKSGIYQIRNLITNKIYIGSAVYFNQRFRQHRFELNHNIHKNSYLQNAWIKYGESNFEFQILEYCEKEKLLEREQFWINWSRCCDRSIGYNINHIAGSSLGIKRSQEMKRKISIIHSGKRLTQETKIKIASARRGKTHSKASILKMSQLKKADLRYRNFDKWPHSEGIKCKCNSCKENKKYYMRNWRMQKSNAN